MPGSTRQALCEETERELKRKGKGDRAKLRRVQDTLQDFV